MTVYDQSQIFIQLFKDHLENAIHGFEYLATNCTEVAQLGPYDDDHHDHDHDHGDNVDDDDDDNNGATSRHRHSLTPDKLSPGHLSTLQDRPDLQVLSVDPPGHHNLQIWTIYLRILIVRNFESLI